MTVLINEVEVAATEPAAPPTPPDSARPASAARAELVAERTFDAREARAERLRAY